MRLSRIMVLEPSHFVKGAADTDVALTQTEAQERKADPRRFPGGGIRYD